MIEEKTRLEKYIEAGLPLCPSGCLNEYQYQKYIGGGVASPKDSTWVRGGKIPCGKNFRYVGHHKCCGSKRSYRHKIDCPYMKKLNSDDLSDLK